MKIKNIAVATIVSLCSMQALAHGGHEHDHWSSSFVHLMMYSAIGIAALGVSLVAYKVLSRHLKGKKSVGESA